MAVISISITESEEQIIAGIPKVISLETNIPASIFYTLDGSVPTLFSTVYTGPIFLPTSQLVVILNIFASNGTDSSAIITEIYQTNMVDGNARLPHAPTNVAPGTSLQELYPFGDNDLQPQGIYGNPADAGVTVDNPAKPTISTGFDSDGYANAFANHEYNIVNYNILYSITNAEGEIGKNIGNLPAKVTNLQRPPPPEESNQFSNTFNPRAFVIFQDSTKENPNDPPFINRMYFTLQDNSTYRDGNAYFSSALDSPTVSGSFVRSHYNPRTNMMTYYYFDSSVNRWIISTTPYAPNGSFDDNLSNMVFSKDRGAGFVFKWVPYARRVLF